MTTTTALHTALAARVLRTQPDPQKWLAQLRSIVECCGLDPTRCIPLGVSLEMVCYAVVDEARKQGPKALELLELAAGV